MEHAGVVSFYKRRLVDMAKQKVIGLQTENSPIAVQIRREFQSHPSRGLTPSTLNTILLQAEQGNIIPQAQLAEDMLERDGHIYSCIEQRIRNVLSLSWSVEPPPRNPSRKEKKAAEYAQDVLLEIPDFEDLIKDMMAGIMYAYSAIEIEWSKYNKERIPKKLHYRLPEWFQLDQDDKNKLKLRDNTLNGEELWPFGWIIHKHKAKSGYLSRAGLVRQLAFPYLFKNYSTADLAELLEIHGIPIGIAKYPPNSKDEEKATLMNALASIGRKARGIIPSTMSIEFLEAAKGSSDMFSTMIRWCEHSVSKIVLGTVPSETDVGSFARDKVSNDKIWDIAISDCQQIASSITNQLIYPILALNAGWDDPRRVPRMVFDTQWEEEMLPFSQTVQNLTNAGIAIDEIKEWAMDRLKIPIKKNNAASSSST